MRIEQINTNLVDTISKFVSLEPKGREMIGICPFHDDHKGSLTVYEKKGKERFKCHACGAGGDAFDFLQLQGYALNEAKDYLAGNEYNPSQAAKYTHKESQPDWVQIMPTARLTEISHYKNGAPSRVWEYKTKTGAPVGYVCRFDMSDGSKEVLPLVYAEKQGKKDWRWQGFAMPRPLYNLDQLTARPDAGVILCEGEKTADALTKIFPSYVCTTWIGGANGIRRTDFSELKGRKILFWSDNDQPGVSAMLHIHYLNKAVFGACKWFEWEWTEFAVEKGFDAADFPADFAAGGWAKQHIKEVPSFSYTRLDWMPADTIAFFKHRPIAGEATMFSVIGTSGFRFIKPRETESENVVLETVLPKPEPKPEPKPAQAPPIPTPPAALVAEPKTEFMKAGINYFRPLGFVSENDKPYYYFYSSHKTQTIVKLPITGMTVQALQDLAPISVWESYFPSKGKSEFDSNSAAAKLSHECAKIGYYDPNRLRGRGAWMDAGKVVVHSGSHLVIDGHRVALEKLESQHVYTRSVSLDFNPEKPLTAAESVELLNLFKKLKWERSAAAYLAAGWCVVAPVGGALTWRPHIWITGGAGSGKSWVMNNIISPLIKNMAAEVAGDTTEAGIRQWLGKDSVPVMYDESESDSKAGVERIQSILNLMRVSSSDGAARVLKGSATGNSVGFAVKSCFALASINVVLKQQADRSRVTVLSLGTWHKHLRDQAEKAFAGIVEKVAEVITPEFAQRLQARTVSMLPTILKNAKTFALAASAHLKTARAGDQLGGLLAGAYALQFDSLISLEDAKKWIEAQDWTTEIESTDERDETVMLQKIMQHQVRIETGAGPYTKMLGQLLYQILFEEGEDGSISRATARETLRKCGIVTDSFGFFVANNSEIIQGILKETGWAVNYHTQLLRIEGAKKSEGPMHILGTWKARCVFIPKNNLGVE